MLNCNRKLFSLIISVVYTLDKETAKWMFCLNTTLLNIVIRHTLRNVQENLRSFMRYTNNEDKNEM